MARRGHDPAKERFWREAIARQRQSGLTIRDFCRREALSEPSFYSWRRTLVGRASVDALPRRARPRRGPVPRSKAIAAARKKAATFVPVALTSTHPAGRGTTAIEIVLRDGVRLCVPAGTDAQTLDQVLSALERRRC